MIFFEHIRNNLMVTVTKFHGYIRRNCLMFLFFPCKVNEMWQKRGSKFIAFRQACYRSRNACNSFFTKQIFTWIFVKTQFLYKFKIQRPEKQNALTCSVEQNKSGAQTAAKKLLHKKNKWKNWDRSKHLLLEHFLQYAQPLRFPKQFFIGYFSLDFSRTAWEKQKMRHTNGHDF